MIPKPFVSLRIYCDQSRHHYFTARVFQTQSDMHEYAASIPGRQARSDAAALTLRWEALLPPNYETIGRDLGEVLFHRRRTGTGVVSHEMTHAAVHFRAVMKERLGRSERDEEEALATCVGYMTRQFFLKY